MHFLPAPLRRFLHAPPKTLSGLAQWFTVFLPVFILGGVAAADIAISVIGLLFVAHSWRAKDWGWMRAAWVRLVLVLWVYLMLRSAFTEHPAEAFLRSLAWLRFLFFTAALAFWTLKEEGTRQSLFALLVFAVVFLIGDALLQYCIGYDLFGRPTFFAPNTWDMRLTGPFSGPKAGIILTWLSFPVVAWALMRQDGRLRSRWQLVWGLAFAVAFLLTVILSGERMALLFTLLGTGLTLLLMPIRKRTACMIGAGLLALGAIVIVLNPALLERQYRSIVHVITHLWQTPYGMLWQSAWEIFKAQPLFGVGPHHFRYACPDEVYGSLRSLASRCNLHPHNIYMEWLSETGIIGFAGWLALVGCWLALVVRALQKYRTDPLVLGLSVALVIRLWPISATTSFFANWSAIPLWMMLGWLLAILEAKRSAGDMQVLK